MKKYLYLIKNSKISTYLKYWLMYSSKKISLLIQSLPITLENTIKDLKIVINKIYGNTIQDGEPSPDNEVPISNVTGDVEVVVENKNFFKDEFIQVPGNTINANLTAGTYTLATCDNNNFDTNIYIKLFDKNSSVITTDGHLTVPSGENMTFSKISYSYWGASNYSYLTFTIDDDYKLNIGLLNTDGTRQVMLLKGSLVERTYTPHKEQTFTFPLGNEKLMLGDYLADDGIHHVRGQVMFDGTENWLAYATGNTENYNCFTIRLETPFKKSNNQYLLINAFSNYFKEVTWIYIYNSSLKQDKPAFGFTIDNNRFVYIKVKNTILTAQDFKSWLAQKYANNSPVIIEYPLNEEVIVPYTSAQQEAYNQIKQALSYEEQTNISSNQNIYLDIDYIKRG